MEDEESDGLFNYGAGYALSVTAAAVVFAVAVMLRNGLHSGLASILSLQAIVLTLLTVLIFWLYAAILALFPVIAMVWIARRLRITHAAYYLFGGFLLSSAAVALFTHSMVSAEEPSTLLERLLYSSEVMLPASLVGMMLFWARVGRHLKT